MNNPFQWLLIGYAVLVTVLLLARSPGDGRSQGRTIVIRSDPPQENSNSGCVVLVLVVGLVLLLYIASNGG